MEPAPTVGGSQADLVRRVVARGDHGGRSFAVIDKRAARLSVFDGTGRLLGSAPVLLGLAEGDRSVPGIGERPLADIRREERTTPAGRFVAEPGRNLAGEDIVWVDYDAAVSLHRVRPLNPAERRLQRLASPTPADNRISYGCVNVPVAFYERWVKPAFATPGGVVYVLPEREPMASAFPALFGPDRGPALAAASTGG
ncbi:L,D-transpeptidase [Aquabacterium sp. J223]|nr:L,D-transpeptidase [Aquabacterium sp. J223]